MTHESTRAFLTGVIAIIAAICSGCNRDTKPSVAIFTLVSHPILDDSIKGIKDSLASQGFTQDNLKITEVNANGQTAMLDAFAREILSSHPDVVIPVSTPVTQTIMRVAPATQAVVFSTVTNPDDVGMDKMPRNMTGVSDAVNYEANLDLIEELFPKAKTLGIIYNAGERNSQFGVEQVKGLAPKQHLDLKFVTVGQPGDVTDAARALAEKVDVFYVGSDNTVVSAIEGLVSIARERRTPVIASDVGSVEKGAIAAVSVDYRALGQKVGEIAGRILREKIMPGQVKNVMFQGNQLIVNKKAAASFGITIPDEVAKRATRVIQ